MADYRNAITAIKKSLDISVFEGCSIFRLYLFLLNQNPGHCSLSSLHNYGKIGFNKEKTRS
jgi:hypothetical protein